ncbi:hypothetical protein [Streptococcus ovis]|uniref:hypothetical protein n=1 Tax=Streptococcus ovis TaxID=82806 RepID=UPI0003A7C470|nr:hypothetical protein [Streptococcus ovis]
MKNQTYVYSLKVVDKAGKESYPVYPFVRSKNDVGILEEFLDQYLEDLKIFFTSKEKYNFNSFAFFKFEFDTATKDKFKSRWFKRGLVVN